jgi:uncharacterized protein DUF4062/NACHT domain-containing protein
MEVTSVFVSSTYEDLIEERAAVIDQLHQMDGVTLIHMETMGVRAGSKRASSLELVDRSDVFVGILGDRYGTGITEAEYRRATQKKIPCLFFLVTRKTGVVAERERVATELDNAELRRRRDLFQQALAEGRDSNDPDLEILKQEFQRLFKSEVQSSCTAKEYGSEAALAAAVMAAVHNEIHSNRARERLWRAEFLESARKDYQEWRSSAFFKRYAEVHVSPESIYLVPQHGELIAGRRRFERYPVPKAVSEFNPLLIIGEPGTGKTTALRQMTSMFLDDAATSPDALLPLFVRVSPLKDLPRDPIAVAEKLIRSTLGQLNPAWAEPPNEFWKRLEKHAFLVQFDGLNEIPETLIKDYCASISALHIKLVERSPRSRLVITSRIDNLARGIDAVRRMSRHIFEVQKLTDDERLGAFVAAQLPEPAKRERFLDLLRGRPAVRLMAQNPFLLTALITFYERSGRLPETRSALLRGLVTTLLLGETPGDSYESDERLRLQHAVLGDLAFELRRRGLGLGAPRSVVDAIVDESFARRIAEDPALRRAVGTDYRRDIISDVVRNRILTEDWSFVDDAGQTVPGVRFWLEVIQEYFAASVVVESVKGLYGPDKSERKRRQRELSEYVESNDWHQVLAIAIGLAPPEPAEQAFRDVCKASPLVAGLCVAGGHTAGEKKFIAMVDHLIRRTVRLTSLFSGVTALVALAIAGAVFWGAQRMYGGGWPVGGIGWADVLPLSLRLGLLLLLAGMPFILTALEKLEDRILAGLLPDRYIQPLLRSLIAAGTERAAVALSRLERDYQRERAVPKAIRFYITQANRVWRFQTEQTSTLLKMLADPLQADYAIDRLEQIGDVGVVEDLIGAARRLPPSSGANAVRAAVKLLQSSEAPRRADFLAKLRNVQTDGTLHRKVRLAAFRGRRALGETTVPTPWFFYWDRLLPRPRTVLLGLIGIGALLVALHLLLQPAVIR